jgi:hypothetical protein
VIFLQWWDWFVKVDSPVTHWKAQPTYILTASVFLLGAAGNLVHGVLKHNIFFFFYHASLVMIMKTKSSN